MLLCTNDETTCGIWPFASWSRVIACVVYAQLGQFFDQWLRRPGVADLTVGWAHDPSAGTVSVLVLQDSARAYAVPLTVELTDRQGAQRRMELEVPAVPRAELVLPGRFAERPVSIVFDPDHFLLARVSRP